MTDESAASRVEDWLRVMAGNAGFRTTRELKSYQNAEKQILDIVKGLEETIDLLSDNGSRPYKTQESILKLLGLKPTKKVKPKK